MNIIVKFFQYFTSVVLMALFVSTAQAVQIEFHQFETKAQEALYLNLIAELRCVKCQNQNLAESNAGIAKDMRDKTYEMVIAGKSRQDIIAYMTARYGDFVLYNPPFKSKTLLLWLGPPLLLLVCFYLLIMRVRKPSHATTEMSAAERESLRKVLNNNTQQSPNEK